MRVQVYKNLRTGLWSVCEVKSENTRGKVIAHAAQVTLSDCRFVVREAQRQWVLRKGERQVHAWVEGEWLQGEEAHPAAHAREFSYNPYRVGHFHVAGEVDSKVESAARVWFSDKAYFA